MHEYEDASSMVDSNMLKSDLKNKWMYIIKVHPP